MVQLGKPIRVFAPLEDTENTEFVELEPGELLTKILKLLAGKRKI